jgi:Zn-finger nucleic acid-binding protein
MGVVLYLDRGGQDVVCLMSTGTKAEFSISMGQWPINCVAKGRYAKKKKKTSYLINYFLG